MSVGGNLCRRCVFAGSRFGKFGFRVFGGGFFRAGVRFFGFDGCFCCGIWVWAYDGFCIGAGVCSRKGL